MMQLIELTHANSGEKISIIKATVQGWFYMESHRSNVIIMSGGTMFPVKESKEEIETIIIKGEPNVRKKLPKRKS